MIILDTNVVSELMKPTPDASVAAWVDELERSTIHAASPTVYEIDFGIGRLPDGQRKERLRAAWQSVLQEFLSDRIMALDKSAASHAAEMKLLALKRGGGSDICDLLIAGIAASHSATLATRNVRDFEDMPIQVVDPWSPLLP